MRRSAPLAEELRGDEEPAVPADRCSAGDGDACWSAAQVLMRAQGPAQPPGPDILLLLDRACQLRNPLACLNLGLASLRGDGGIPQEPALARALHLRSCELGLPVACARSAALINQGIGGPADREEAERLLRRACTLGDPGACEALPR